MKYHTLMVLVLSLLVSLITGCGGGGGGGGAEGTSGGSSTTQSTAPGTISIQLATKGEIPPGNYITGFVITLNLPAGVNVKQISPSDYDITGINDAAGKINILAPTVTANSGGAGSRISFAAVITDPAGLKTTGNFLSLNCTTSPGPVVTSSDFSINTSQTAVSDKDNQPLALQVEVK